MKRTPALIVILSLVMLLGCATSQMGDSYRNAQYTGGQVKSVLVLGVAKRFKMRQAFESSFAADLAKAGIKAQPSFDVLPQGKPLDGDVVAAAARKLNMQTVLVVHYRGYDSETQAPKGYRYGPDYSALPTFLPTVNSYVANNDYPSSKNFLRMECNLYDVAEQKLIWTGHSKLVQSGNLDKITADLAGLVVAQLKKDGLLQ